MKDIRDRREYYLKNKDRYIERQKKRFEKCPWVKTFKNIVGRCGKNSCYGKKDIKNYLITADVKFLWFRDKAYLMLKPSIDRIDAYGNYNLKNSRFIELKDNLKRKKLNNKWALKYDKCIKCGTNEIVHHSKGRCEKCYQKSRIRKRNKNWRQK